MSDAAVDDATARRFASHPGTRVWVARDGERWLIHDLSYLARWRRQGPRELMLIDEEGAPHHVEVTESLELGQLTDDEIGELLRLARIEPRGRDGGGGSGAGRDGSTIATS